MPLSPGHLCVAVVVFVVVVVAMVVMAVMVVSWIRQCTCLFLFNL